MDDELGEDFSETEDDFMNKLRLTPTPLPKDYWIKEQVINQLMINLLVITGLVEVLVNLNKIASIFWLYRLWTTAGDFLNLHFDFVLLVIKDFPSNLKFLLEMFD